MGRKAHLLIPVENQVRELDPKLLFAYVAARRGFPSVIGPIREMHFLIPSFPRSIYVSKSITPAGGKIFPYMRKLGHEIVAWDEEALVHPPSETYYSKRLSPIAMQDVAHLFAWGQDNADLWRGYSALPAGARIHITGNPRGDLLRPDMRGFFQEEVNKLREKYGDFILVNTNFNHVNAFYPALNLFKPVNRPREEPQFGRTAKGMSRQFAEGLRNHKQTTFEHFQRMIPDLEQAFPEYTIIVRPHPTENFEVYHRIAARCPRVRVINEGHVLPWLLASRVLVHNGCTTGVEAYAAGVPVATYQATVNEYYDYGFYRLPNLLSHQCFDFDQLRETLGKILAGELGIADGGEREALIACHLAAQDGPLASQRIVDVLEAVMGDQTELPKSALWDRLYGWYKISGRSLRRRLKSFIPGFNNRREFLKHRYPGISLKEVRQRIARFQHILGDGEDLKVEQMGVQFFRIGPRVNNR